ncbi:alcohol dehydrogenase catalytic domain-containing protein [Lysinibacillus fusiformis]|uniref:alcohol dehydrogenase catalytic domain-containing protein n=1 Tax=Lysinibacillus fusiformis TaxID=28031 RepID=UPI0023A95D76|nr:alcohol dehydrogenase catalytic domain-containing protein [Lysinibacillus fusiformis]WEA41244.1 alcohol dehydrogenase catalytic domain-containing protein [Lysinibacillus fusiformis]
MRMMKAIQVPSKGESMKLVDVSVPKPGEGQVLLRVKACGVCHGDSRTINGGAPEYPRIPGHEVIGVVEEVGAGSNKWEIGDRVGIGYHGGNKQVTGLTTDGGFAEYMVANEGNLIGIPHELTALEAAPLMCAGETTFSALKNSKARPGDLVAILGIGGLGHLAVQYANKAGFCTVAISRGTEKEGLVRQLGAHHYIDSEKEEPASALQKLGGAKVILATAPNSKAISSLINGLSSNSELIIIAGSNEPLELSTKDFIKGPNNVKGSFTGQANEIQDAVNFSLLTNVRPIIETFPLERASEAYEKMMAASIHFRAVLNISE